MARPQLSAVAVEAMRQRLTALALELYLAEGLEALSFRRLAEAAGISHTLPYRYFANKEALLVAVRVECTQRFERFVRQREPARSAPLVRIRTLAAAYVEFVRRHPGEYQMIFTMAQPAPDQYPELLAARRSLFDHAVGLVQEAIDAGLLSGDALELAHLFWVSLHGLITLHVAGQLVHGRRLEDLLEPLVVRMLTGAAGVPGPASAGARPPARRRGAA